MGRRRNKGILRLRRRPKPRGEMRNWLELPRDVTVSILTRLSAIDVLQSAQKVCTAWYSIFKDPLTWRTIDMRNDGHVDLFFYDLDKMCRELVDRSCGHLLDLNLECFGTDDLLKYITTRCHGIRRLRLAACYHISDEGLSEVASKLPLLEELEISLCSLSRKSVEAVGRSCPLLKSFKLNRQWYFSPDNANGMDGFEDDDDDDDDDDYDDFEDDYNGGFSVVVCKDDEAQAIAGTMRGLRHLQLFGNQLTDDGLRQILDSCPHLESLDLRYCLNLNTEGDVGKICAQQIKKLRLPRDCIDDYEFPPAVYECGAFGLPDGLEDYDGDVGYGYQSDDLLSAEDDLYQEYLFSIGA